MNPITRKFALPLLILNCESAVSKVVTINRSDISTVYIAIRGLGNDKSVSEADSVVCIWALKLCHLTDLQLLYYEIRGSAMIAVPHSSGLFLPRNKYQLFKVLYEGCSIRCGYYLSAGVIYIYATGVVIVPQDYFVLGCDCYELLARSGI